MIAQVWQESSGIKSKLYHYPCDWFVASKACEVGGISLIFSLLKAEKGSLMTARSSGPRGHRV